MLISGHVRAVLTRVPPTMCALRAAALPQLLPGANANRGYSILGPAAAPAVLHSSIPPPPPTAQAPIELVNDTITSECALQCGARASCIGYRVSSRVVSRTSTLGRGHCVLIKALRSTRVEDCDLMKLRRTHALSPDGAPGQTLSLRETRRSFRKPCTHASDILISSDARASRGSADGGTCSPMPLSPLTRRCLATLLHRPREVELSRRRRHDYRWGENAAVQRAH